MNDIEYANLAALERWARTTSSSKGDSVINLISRYRWLHGEHAHLLAEVEQLRARLEESAVDADASAGCIKLNGHGGQG